MPGGSQQRAPPGGEVARATPLTAAAGSSPGRQAPRPIPFYCPAMPNPPPFRRLAWLVVAAALCGASYNWLNNNAPQGGALAGAMIAAGLFLLERFVLRRGTASVVSRLPFLAYFVLRSVAYVAVIVLATSFVTELRFGVFALIGGADLLFSLALSVRRESPRCGQRTAWPGRAVCFRRRPLSSAAHRGAGAPVHRHALLDRDRGAAGRSRLPELPQPLRRGRIARDRGGERRNPQIRRRRSDCDVEARARRRRAGMRPRLLRGSRPASRAGAGVRARVRAARRLPRRASLRPRRRRGTGTLKKEIALIGDAMNAAARIHEACRAADERVLASAAFIDRLGNLPARVARRRLGELPMRGKARPLELYVLESAG